MATNTNSGRGWRALVLATISFTVSYTAWGLIGGVASVFVERYRLTASETALLVAIPVLLGSVARLPMGMLTDRFGGRAMFTRLMVLSGALLRSACSPSTSIRRQSRHVNSYPTLPSVPALLRLLALSLVPQSRWPMRLAAGCGYFTQEDESCDQGGTSLCSWECSC